MFPLNSFYFQRQRLCSQFKHSLIKYIRKAHREEQPTHSHFSLAKDSPVPLHFTTNLMETLLQKRPLASVRHPTIEPAGTGLLFQHMHFQYVIFQQPVSQVSGHNSI